MQHAWHQAAAERLQANPSSWHPNGTPAQPCTMACAPGPVVVFARLAAGGGVPAALGGGPAALAAGTTSAAVRDGVVGAGGARSGGPPGAAFGTKDCLGSVGGPPVGIQSL